MPTSCDYLMSMTADTQFNPNAYLPGLHSLEDQMLGV